MRKSVLPTFSVLELFAAVALFALLFTILRHVPGLASAARVLGITLAIAMTTGLVSVGLACLRRRWTERRLHPFSLFCLVTLATFVLELVWGTLIGMAIAMLSVADLQSVADFVLDWLPVTPLQHLAPPGVPGLVGAAVGMEFGALIGLLIGIEVALHATKRQRSEQEPSSIDQAESPADTETCVSGPSTLG